jgi:anthranilate phosphoribosyltransferase
MAESTESVRHLLERVVTAHETLSRVQATALMRHILAGDVSDAELSALLLALNARGETAAELAGFATAMREAATPLPLTPTEQAQVVDTCGTGGDASGSFNISTAAALVAAAAGAKVAKHGNRAITSACGSADVLEALGIPVQLAPQAAVAALRDYGFCFLLAPSHHPALKAVMPVRRALGVRTVFNVLGPLLNPAGARRQVMGVYSARLVPVVAEALALLGAEHAMVVHGDGGQDELALSGPSEIAEVRFHPIGTVSTSSQRSNHTRAVRPAARSARAHSRAAMPQRMPLSSLPSSPARPGRAVDVVLLNAAAVLVVAALAKDIGEGVELAAHAIDSRAVARLVEQLRRG